MQVLVSIAPQKYFVERIGGEHVQVTVLVKPGSDPHSYEPRASQMAAAARSGLYFTAGLGLEAAWASRIHDVSPDLRLIRLYPEGRLYAACGAHHHDGPDGSDGHDHLHESHEHSPHGKHEGQPHSTHGEHEGHEHPHDGHARTAHGRHGGHDHSATEPELAAEQASGLAGSSRASVSPRPESGHAWLSPALVREMVPGIVEALSSQMPEYAAEFSAGGESFMREIDALDRDINELFKDIPKNKRNFITFHPAWGDFAHDYGLNEVSLEHDGKEPGPRRLTKLARFAVDNGIKTIFAEPQHSARSANAIAESINAKVVIIDPLAENWADNLLHCAGQFASSMRQGL